MVGPKTENAISSKARVPNCAVGAGRQARILFARFYERELAGLLVAAVGSSVSDARGADSGQPERAIGQKTSCEKLCEGSASTVVSLPASPSLSMTEPSRINHTLLSAAG